MTDDDRIALAAREGDAATLATLLDARPALLAHRTPPYDWTLLHLAAHGGHLAAVDLLLARGLDANVRERGDETTPLHWAAAAGQLDVVRRLLAAGGDPVGAGDDHELDVIGWATCWDGSDDAPHRAVVDALLAAGARHHVFSAIALELADEVRRIVAADPQQLERPMSANESRQRPLHFAVRMNRPAMVELLLALGADPTAGDAQGMPPVAYASSPEVDARTVAPLHARGAGGVAGALLAGDEGAAEALLARGGDDGALHIVAKRGDARLVRWLLDRGADPNARWSHWGAVLTPLHLAAQQGHVEVVRVLLAAGADRTIRDSLHDGDAAGWAEFGRVPPAPAWREVVAVLR